MPISRRMDKEAVVHTHYVFVVVVVVVVIANLMKTIHKNKFEIHQKKENNVNQLYFTKKKIIIIICLKSSKREAQKGGDIYILISL